MINVKNNGMVDARELHKLLEIKTRFAMWISRVIETCGFEENKEFCSYLGKTISSQGGGRPTQEYDLTVDSAKEACIIGDSKKSSQVRKYLIGLSNQKDNFDLLSHEQVLYLVRLKEVFKYLSNCKESTKLHEKTFVDNSSARNPYAEFHSYRNEVLNLGKTELDTRLKEYCINNHRLVSAKMNQHDKLALLNQYDILRNGVWDYLMASGSNEQSMKLANLVRDMAKVEGISLYRKNEDTLFNKKEDNVEIKQLIK